MVVCDRCEACAHKECSRVPIHDGPWYCQSCRTHIITNGPEDVVEDLQLIDWLFLGKKPKDEIALHRVEQLGQVFRARGRELQANVRTPYNTFTWVDVPPVPLRHQLVRDFHVSLGHVGRDKLLEALREWYWWPGMTQSVQ